MFDVFQSNFVRDLQKNEPLEESVTILNIPMLAEFFIKFGGASFNRGLYRTIHPSQLTEWQNRIHFAFPEFEGRVVCFGFDWLGRAFALDSARHEGGHAGVTMFEPGTGEALDIPSNLRSFHDNELIEFGEAALAISFYDRWLKISGAHPKYDQCVGYKTPLFLGGADEVENIEMSDIDVYWHLMGQLICKTRGLPEGTRVNVTAAQE